MKKISVQDFATEGERQGFLDGAEDLKQMALDTIDLDVSMVQRAINLNVTVTDQEVKIFNEAIEALNSLRELARIYLLNQNAPGVIPTRSNY